MKNRVFLLMALLCALAFGLSAQTNFKVIPASPNNADNVFSYVNQGQDIFGEAYSQWYLLNEDSTCGARQMPSLCTGEWKIWNVSLSSVTVDTNGSHPVLYEGDYKLAMSADTMMLYHNGTWSWFDLQPDPTWSYMGASFNCTSMTFDMAGKMTYNEATRKVDMMLGWTNFQVGHAWNKTGAAAKYATTRITFFLPVNQFPVIVVGTSYNVQDYILGKRLRPEQRWLSNPDRMDKLAQGK